MSGLQPYNVKCLNLCCDLVLYKLNWTENEKNPVCLLKICQQRLKTVKTRFQNLLLWITTKSVFLPKCKGLPPHVNLTWPPPCSNPDVTNSSPREPQSAFIYSVASDWLNIPDPDNQQWEGQWFPCSESNQLPVPHSWELMLIIGKATVRAALCTCL